jgi:hypothetical protein
MRPVRVVLEADRAVTIGTHPHLGQTSSAAGTNPREARFQYRSAGGGSAAQATVLIRRADGQPVAGVAVAARWTRLVEGAATATTDVDGRAVFTSKSVRRQGQVTFTVTGASKTGTVYDASQNAETSESVVIP